MTTSLTRRDALRLLVLASASAALLAACGDEKPVPDGSAPGDAELGLVSSDLKRVPGDPGAVPDVVAAMAAFAGGLYGGLREVPGNLVLSPYSVAVALGMTLNGAAGETAAQMRTALGLDEPGLDDLATDGFNQGMNALTAHIDSLAGPQRRADGSKAEIELAVASALFGEQTMTWRQQFLDVLAQEYGAGLQTVDYLGAAEQARELINGWTSERTGERIPELIPPGVLDALTRLVLVNALYLKAPWETPFEKTLTEPAPFLLVDGSTVDVDTMRAAPVEAQLSAGEGWRAARLPYAGAKLAMTVVLPDEGAQEAVEAGLARDGVAPYLAPGKPTGLDLRLPRWTFRSPSDLNPVLQGLGMRDAFAPPVADFSAMTDAADLYVSAVLHEAFIAVDEEGTEAAAATAVIMSETSAPVLEPFVVDRPFLFVIHDTAQATPLFLGRVADPRA